MANIRIAAPITSQWQRANAKASANAARGLRAERIAERTYRVKSATSTESYIVTVESIVNLQAHCTCSAGQHGIICWHQSSAIAAAVQRCAAKAAPVAPASAPMMDDFGRYVGPALSAEAQVALDARTAAAAERSRDAVAMMSDPHFD